jgi:hypothetical protein
MNFDDLYTLALEAAKNFGSAKNTGGQRIKGVKDSEGPSGIVSSPIGKSNYNPQEIVPIDQKNKKGFDPKAWKEQQKANIEVTDEKGKKIEVRRKTGSEKQNVFSMIGDQKKALYNSFALLNNSEYFKKQISEIIEKFGKAKNIKLEEERDLKNLRDNISRYDGWTTELRDKFDKYQEIFNNYNDSEEVKIKDAENLRDTLASYKSNLENLNEISGGTADKDSIIVNFLKNLGKLTMRKISLLKNLTSKNAIDELEKLNSEIFKIETKINDITSENPKLSTYVEKFKNYSKNIEKLSIKTSHHELKDADILHITKIFDDTKKKLREVKGDAAENRAKFDNLYDYVSKISAYNENINDTCIEKFKNAVMESANGILKSEFEKFDPNSVDAKQIDWDSNMPTRGDVYKMLTSLATPNNPIFKFIEKLDMSYLDERGSEDETRGAVRHNIDRAMSDNENITIIRDKESLPFFTIAQYLKTVSIVRMPISSPITTESFREAYRQFFKLCNIGRESQWNNGAFKMRLKKLLGIDLGMNVQTGDNFNMGAAIPDFDKLEIDKYINSPYDDKGVKSFKKLLSMVDSRLKGAFPRQFESLKPKLQKGGEINESFDELASKYASSFNLDINDFLIDLQEVNTLLESKCTGPTKKASSDRKGKKWTKCARQPDGSYKRIHWGQAGVRVGKDNPKRRKSFRARHKCSSAKSGSPKAAACADW